MKELRTVAGRALLEWGSQHIYPDDSYQVTDLGADIAAIEAEALDDLPWWPDADRKCTHEGIGLPWCPTCGPRTRARLKVIGFDWDDPRPHLHAP